ncbi:tripartite tricarboxylate transporter substrate binding protein [Ottowia sp.]|uniref:Bug family tripartite tricarboxylate transporter substrate binding protein n=1 Tax=Ottowia sp. TaxID=1898956 RepID=UPI002C72EB3A|nr:tripartite tricarboxylate transporter substrate binding protein [Ottowia sp.]HRN76076.1 tripartite tricarboxylate transporter substrate binding protein [Ottowia sp.]
MTASPLQVARHLTKIVVASALFTMAGLASAAYPERPITLVVPFAPGGSSDNVARTIGPLLGEKLGQPIVIDNVGGAGGMLGTQKAVRAQPDGYTILVGSGSEILINKLINPKVTYDGIKDLTPAAFLATGPMVLVGKTSLPAKDVPELLALARSKPGALSYGSAGNGTPMHVAGELMKIRAKIFMTHIPYRGAAPALVDVMSGQVDLAVSTLSAALPHIRADKIRAYAVTSPKPSELAPSIPALGAAKGLEGFDLGVWFGLFMPLNTPADIVQKVQDAAIQVMSDPAIKKRLADQGLVASGASADVLKQFMAAEVEKYRGVITAAKITAE